MSTVQENKSDHDACWIRDAQVTVFTRFVNELPGGSFAVLGLTTICGCGCGKRRGAKLYRSTPVKEQLSSGLTIASTGIDRSESVATIVERFAGGTFSDGHSPGTQAPRKVMESWGVIHII